MGEQRLVCGHHRLAGVERGAAQSQRRAVGAADQLDHNIDLGVRRQGDRVVVPAESAEVDAAAARAMARGDRRDLEGAAGTLGDQAAILRQQPQHGAAHGAEPGDAQAQRLGHGFRPRRAPAPARAGRGTS